MSIKKDVLTALEQNRGISISGEELAKDLNVTRAGVWKAINQLKKEGYQINASTNLGYSLSNESNIISEEAIKLFLWEKYQDNPIFLYKTIDSTSNEAKKMAINGAPAGTAVIAEEQTNGRGRQGRSFFSPGHQGVYLSMVVKPDINLTDAVLITTAVSVGVALAIEELTPLKPEIKWVNDLYLSGKKICGILTEAVTDFESGTIESVVIGIGVNFLIDESELSPELKEIVGSLFVKGDDIIITRNQLAAAIINHTLSLLDDLSSASFIKEYKKRSLVLGKKIKFLESGSWHQGVALDIDERGGLIIECNGEKRTLNSGEISVRSLEK